MEQAALYIHLLGVVLFIAGSIGLAVLRHSAVGREKTVEIYTLLSLCRPLAALVGTGFVILLCGGIWLANIEDSWSEVWLMMSLCFVIYMLIVGAFAGRRDRKTREMCFLQLSQDRPDNELIEKLKDPLNYGLNMSMIAAITVVFSLMIFRPN